jgi:hypothetical protein
MRGAIPALPQYVFIAWWLIKQWILGCIQKFHDWVGNEITNTCWEATQRVMAAKLTGLTHNIAIQLHLVAESCNICSSLSRRPVRKLLDTLSYVFFKARVNRACSTNRWPEKWSQDISWGTWIWFIRVLDLCSWKTCSVVKHWKLSALGIELCVLNYT